MLLKLLLSLVAFVIGPFHGPPVDVSPDVTTPYGPPDIPLNPFAPLNETAAQEAFRALYHDNVHDDMLFADDYHKNAGIKDTKYRWDGYPGKAEVPYVIDQSLQRGKALILFAMKQFHDHTCVRFVERTNQKNYINIVLGKGCSSYVGKIHRGAQPVTLAENCVNWGTIVHELGHAIGLHHEHQRSDRDEYLNVYTQNVIQGHHHNFDKTPEDYEIIFGDYDYTSIMHYGNYAFSKSPGRLMTMEAKDGTQLKEPYEKPGLNQNDIDMINKLYKCE